MVLLSSSQRLMLKSTCFSLAMIGTFQGDVSRTQIRPRQPCTPTRQRFPRPLPQHTEIVADRKRTAHRFAHPFADPRAEGIPVCSRQQSQHEGEERNDSESHAAGVSLASLGPSFGPRVIAM